MASKYWRQIFKVVTCSISLRKSLFVTSGFGTIYQFKKSSNFANFSHLTFAASPNDIFLSKFQEKIEDPTLGVRGRRFLEFASVIVENELFMTPKDFLESIIEENCKPRYGHQQLNKEEALELVKSTPARDESSFEFFRSLNTKGLISYTEYLFLLSLLTKPKSGFEIAFKMFDVDDNHIVDLKEFLVLGEIFQKRSNPDNNLSSIPQKHSSNIPTTLTTHFFGINGDQVFNYPDFFRFMDNLQTEILEMEISFFEIQIFQIYF